MSCNITLISLRVNRLRLSRIHWLWQCMFSVFVFNMSVFAVKRFSFWSTPFVNSISHYSTGNTHRNTQEKNSQTKLSNNSTAKHYKLILHTQCSGKVKCWNLQALQKISFWGKKWEESCIKKKNIEGACTQLYNLLRGPASAMLTIWTGQLFLSGWHFKCWMQKTAVATTAGKR